MSKNEFIEKILSDFHKLEKEKIYPFFENEFGSLNSAYILGQGIDQGVDIYTYLVNGKYVIEFDVSTIDHSIIKNSIIPIEEYKKTIQGKGRVKKEDRDRLNRIIKEICAN